MLAARSRLIATAGLAGLVLAAAIWLVIGMSGMASASVDQLQARLAAERAPVALAVAPSGAAARAIAAPIFALTTGPGAVSDVSVRLDGIALSPKGQSALLEIDGKPAEWLALGVSKDGVTLMEVHPSKVVIDTAVGFKEVALGQQSAPLGQASSAPSNAIPPGTRRPPPPASAPSAK